jgi:hypothetical protein
MRFLRRNRRSVLVIAWLPLLAVAACGNNVVTGTGGAGGGMGGAGGGTGGGTGGGDTLCPADQKPIAPVTFLIANNDLVDIYLRSDCGEVAYSVAASAGGAAVYPGTRSCLQTCQDLTKESRFQCDPCAPQAFLLKPGESRKVTWDGAGLLGTGMPEKCFFSQADAGDCSQLVAAQPADYIATATPYSACPDCTCDATGECSGEVAAGREGFAQPTKLSFPTNDVISIAFQTCTFGCP